MMSEIECQRCGNAICRECLGCSVCECLCYADTEEFPTDEMLQNWNEANDYVNEGEGEE